MVAIVGANGVGNSSLHAALAKILSSQSRLTQLSGRLWRLGNIGYLFQTPKHQLATSSVRTELAFGGVAIINRVTVPLCTDWLLALALLVIASATRLYSNSVKEFSRAQSDLSATTVDITEGT